METKDMTKGVQILLERMESNPEEFYTDETKWLALLGMVISRAKQLAGERPPAINPLVSGCCLPDEEVIVLHKRMQQIQTEEFTHRVMERLLHDDEKYLATTTSLTAAQIKQQQLVANTIQIQQQFAAQGQINPYGNYSGGGGGGGMVSNTFNSIAQANPISGTDLFGSGKK
jgi:hypothetical protein